MNLDFLRITYYISIGILFLGSAISAAYIIPLQIQQAKVKNGLALLRRLMLIQGVLNATVGIISVIVLVLPLFFDGKDISLLTISLVLLFSLGFFTFTVIWVIMYRQQFTTEQKRLHVKIAKQEEKENK